MRRVVEIAAGKAWLTSKRRAHSTGDVEWALPTIQETTETCPEIPDQRPRSGSSPAEIQSLSPVKMTILDVDAPSFQPGAPQHPMQPGVGFSLVRKRHRGPTRALTELEYLTSPAPSSRDLTGYARREVQLGREDLWLLLLQNSRTHPVEGVCWVAGRLLFELEQYFWSCAVPGEGGIAPDLTLRDEAMLEEAARLVRLAENDLRKIMENAKVIKAGRARHQNRETF